MRLFILIFSFLLGFSFDCNAGDCVISSNLTEQDFINCSLEKVNDTLLFELDDFDVNGDKFISLNEISILAQDATSFPSFSEDKKEIMKQKIFDFFKQSDVDNDSRLVNDEFKNFMHLYNEYSVNELAKIKFAQLDYNNDGVYNQYDIPPLEVSLAKLDKTMRDAELLKEKIQNINTEDTAKNMVEQHYTAMESENFFQMDKNKDSCVDIDEYSAYQVELQKEYQQKPEYWLSIDDFQKLYNEIEKENKDCLTKQEYINYVKSEMFI